MIEPHHAARLGFSANFRRDDRAAVDRAVARMTALGARHLRVSLPAEMAGDAWLTWMLMRLGEDLDLLVRLSSGVVGDSSVARFLDLHGRCLRALEIPDFGGEPHLVAGFVRDAADGAAAHGNRLVLDMSSAADLTERVCALGSAGALEHLAAIGVRAQGRDAHSPGDMVQIAGDALRAAGARTRIWITQTGWSTWRHELTSQARLFSDAMSSSADRIFWRALSDDPEADTRDEDAHFGIDDAAGAPKLLGRLLAGGVAEVERVVALTGRHASPVPADTRPVLVTGGAGFIGANLADRLASDGHDVVIYDALTRAGVERNLRWLARRHPARINFVLGDLRDEAALSTQATQARAVVHLAGQVAVTTSMVTPLTDFEVNARGTLTLLDALRLNNPEAPLIFASTNKVYGDLADIALVRDGECYVPQDTVIRANGISETRPLCFHTPYGCSKGTADQYVLDYAHSFGLRTAVLRMSCIYGERQLGTEDQGWVAHFLLRAIAGEALTIYGDGRQVRDILHVGDAVDAYMAIWANIATVSGRAYNLGGGPGNAISLLQLVEHIESLLGRRIDVEFSAWRPGDQRYFVADTTAIRRDLSLPPALDWRRGLARLAEHFGATLSAQVQVTEAAL